MKSLDEKNKQYWTKSDYEKHWEDLHRDQTNTIDHSAVRILNFGFMFATRRMVTTPAYQALTSSARLLLVGCWCMTDVEFTPKRAKKGSDKKPVHYKFKPFQFPYNAAKLFGLKSDATIARAFKELKKFGFISQIGIATKNRPAVYVMSYEHERLTKEQCQDLKKQK